MTPCGTALTGQGIARVLIFLFVFVAGAVITGCAEERSDDRGLSGVEEKLIVDASNRGVAWLLENQGVMDASRAFSNAHKLYRSVADQSLATHIRTHGATILGRLP